MRFIFAFLLVFFSCSAPSFAQEKGLLAQVLNDSCSDYLRISEREYKNFCSGYIEALIEQKEHKDNANIYSCFPTYGEYDPFKRKVVKLFMKDFESHTVKGNEYIRAFNLVNNAIQKQLKLDCKKN